MDELLVAAINELVEETFLEVVKATGENPECKEDVKEMNRLFDACLEAHHNARQYALLFIVRAMKNYFEKGFWAGVEFAIEFESADTEKEEQGDGIN